MKRPHAWPIGTARDWNAKSEDRQRPPRERAILLRTVILGTPPEGGGTSAQDGVGVADPDSSGDPLVVGFRPIQRPVPSAQQCSKSPSQFLRKVNRVSLR